MHVDFKITTWERVEVPEDKADEVLAKCKSGEIESANDLIDFLGEGSAEKLTDTDEQMTVEENGGCSVVEVWEGSDNIFENGKEE